MSWAVGLGVLVLYASTFASVPTSDGLSFIATVDSAVASGTGRLPIISNAPFSYYLAFLLKRAALGLHLPVSTLGIFQGLNAVVSGLGAVALYRTIRVVGGARFWAVVGTMLVMTSYGVWYFANGEVHHVGLAILLFLFYRLMVIRQPAGIEESREEPSPYFALVSLGLLNAVAVFFHQEHFLFGLVAVALLLHGRPWRRGLREAATYAVAGTVGTFALIFLVGRFLAGAATLGGIVAWYFWQLGYLARDYAPESLGVIALRVVKGQLTAFVYGVQVVADAARDRLLLASWTVRALIALTLVTLVVAGLLATALWRERRRITGNLRAMALGALAWLVVYPLLLSWYFPAVTEYYLKTLPPLILLLLIGPIARERAGEPSRWLRAVGAALLLLVVLVNTLSAIVPWYRYGGMRERLTQAAVATFRPGDLAVSLESGLDAVLAGHVDQLAVKNLLYKEGKARGFDTVRSEIRSRLDAGHRVFVHNLLPSRWALEGLNAPGRNPLGDRYETQDFEVLLADLRAHHDLVAWRTYWEESKEPMYLFGHRWEAIFEVRRRL